MKINTFESTSYKYESTTTVRIVGPTVHVHKVCAAKYLHSFVLSYFVRSGAEVSYNFISGSTSGSTVHVQYHKYFLYSTRTYYFYSFRSKI